MVDILDIFYSLVREFKSYVPTAKHYIGSLPENFKSPYFLYRLVFNSDTKSSYFTKDVVVDIQVVYFDSKEIYPTSKLEAHLKAMSLLKGFLSQFNVDVKDRNLKFDCSFGTADEQLTIDMQFKFKDGLVNIKYDEEQAREMIERIFINEKEVI